ncbi:hypothetical protein [Streptomyces sp. NPDC056291]|uniref:hypothetical protein n=1 Tax=Streptomyces sp. NPDC056291 TaxID=3345772 RepID=UPI0035DC3293
MITGTVPALRSLSPARTGTSSATPDQSGAPDGSQSCNGPWAGAAHDTETDGRGGYYYTRYNKTEQRTEEITLTEDEYHVANKAQARIFASMAACFHAMGGFLILVAASPEATWHTRRTGRRSVKGEPVG